MRDTKNLQIEEAAEAFVASMTQDDVPQIDVDAWEEIMRKYPSLAVPLDQLPF